MLGRSLIGLRAYRDRNHLAPTRHERWVTSGEASRRCGLTPQWLTTLARAGQVRARRVPGGHWWLFDPAALPRRREP